MTYLVWFMYHTHTHKVPCSAEDLLRVEFAGVAIGGPKGSERWLGTHLRGRRVWCTLLHPTPDGEAAQCVVYAQKKVSQCSVQHRIYILKAEQMPGNTVW